MAKNAVVISDLSGDPADGKYTLTVAGPDETAKLDITAKEYADFAKKGTVGKKRGRKAAEAAPEPPAAA